jgi:hypothetical protein
MSTKPTKLDLQIDNIDPQVRYINIDPKAKYLIDIILELDKDCKYPFYCYELLITFDMDRLHRAAINRIKLIPGKYNWLLPLL